MKLSIHLLISGFQNVKKDKTLEVFNNSFIKANFVVNPRMMKEIEILVTMNVSTEMFLSTLAKNQIVIDLGQYYLNKQKQNKKGPIVLNYGKI